MELWPCFSVVGCFPFQIFSLYTAAPELLAVALLLSYNFPYPVDEIPEEIGVDFWALSITWILERCTGSIDQPFEVGNELWNDDDFSSLGRVS